MIRMILTTAAALSLGLASAAQAQTTRTVAYGDLDISKPAGAEVLLKRLENAGRTVCGAEPSVRELRQRQLYRECREAAVSQAVASVHSPMLTALYEGTPLATQVKTASR